MNQRDVVPKWVVKGGYIKDFNFGPVQFSVNFMGIFSKSTVRLQYFTLTEVKPNARNQPFLSLDADKGGHVDTLLYLDEIQ
jgi:hypothetical protein